MKLNPSWRTSDLVFQKSGNEDRRKEKRAKINQIETFAAELEELLKRDGNIYIFFLPFVFFFNPLAVITDLKCVSLPAGQDYLSPVVGFYCKKCQEFIGDLSSADGHADMHGRSSTVKPSGAAVVGSNQDQLKVEGKPCWKFGNSFRPENTHCKHELLKIWKIKL